MSDQEFFLSTTKIKPHQLARIIESVGLTVDREKVDAFEYPLPDQSLKHHLRLRRAISKKEVTTHKKAYKQITGNKPTSRFMGVLWFGGRYNEILVIEAFGEDIQDEMSALASHLVAELGYEVRVIPRPYRMPRFE